MINPNTLSILGVAEDEPTLFSPENDDVAREIEEHIDNHPLAESLRADSRFTESRPHLTIPAKVRATNLTAGTLAGTDKIPVAPYIWSEEGGKSLTSMFYLGANLTGHPGIVHGGILATLLDEGLARCCFPALPGKKAVTAHLSINYRKPAPAGSFFVLRATTTQVVDGRKATVTGRIETLPEEGKEPVVIADADALFVVPKGLTVCLAFGLWPFFHSLFPSFTLLFPLYFVLRLTHLFRAYFSPALLRLN